MRYTLVCKRKNCDWSERCNTAAVPSAAWHEAVVLGRPEQHAVKIVVDEPTEDG